jgi:hypothetical protein
MTTSFMWVAGDETTIRFTGKKVTFCFNRPRNPDVDARSRELKVQKILKSMASLRRNQDLPDTPVIKPIGTVICPK